MITWRIWEGSPSIAGSSSATSSLKAAFFEIEILISGAISSIRALKSRSRVFDFRPA